MDETREVFWLARALCREVANGYGLPLSTKNRIASAGMCAAVVSLACDDPRLATSAGVL